VIAAGFSHFVMAVRPPAPDNIARWLAGEIIAPVPDQHLTAGSGLGR
jgi:hypothetical protein